MAPPRKDWQAELRDFLIAGGTNGWGQKEIVKKMESIAQADDIRDELLFLLNCDPPKVQKFVVPTKGRPKTIWRATVHILKGMNA